MKLVFGDNPFFAINHRDGGYSRLGSVANEDAVLSVALESGFETLMLSAHPTGFSRVVQRLGFVNAANSGASSMDLALVAPLPHAFNEVAAAKGYSGVLRFVGFSTLIFFLFALLARACSLSSLSAFFAARGLSRVMRSERKVCAIHGVQIKYLCMHNIFTDLILASGKDWILKMFASGAEKLGYTPVFITQNMGGIVDVAPSKSVICGSYNSRGYMVTPSLADAREKMFLRDDIEIWAMQILAGGSISPTDAIKFLQNQKIDGVIYATSVAARVEEFRSLLQDSQ